MAGFGIIDTKEAPYRKYGIFLCRPLTCNLSVYIIFATIPFIFGYETGVSSGFVMTMMDSLILTPADHVSNPFSKFNHRMDLSAFISSFYAAAAVAWVVSPWLKTKFGTRKPMLFASTCLTCGSGITGLATTLRMLVGARMLIGFGIGLSFYIIPPSYSQAARMKKQIPYHVFVSLGFSAANYANSLGGSQSWFIMTLSVVIFMSSCFLHEEEENKKKRRWDERKWAWRELVWNKKNRPHLVIVILLALVPQLTGRNFLVLFSPLILHAMGQTIEVSLTATAFFPLFWVVTRLWCDFAFRCVGSVICSRRNILITCGISMAIFNRHIAGAVGWEYYNNVKWSSPKCCLMANYMLAVMILLHVFSCGLEHVSWKILIDNLPKEIAAVAWELSTTMELTGYALITQFGLSWLASSQLGMFVTMSNWVLWFMLILSLLLPEEKNSDSDNQLRYLWNEHWAWELYLG